jgi:hypothetical protein
MDYYGREFECKEYVLHVSLFESDNPFRNS